MGQKINPHGIRVGVIKDWSTKWYSEKAGKSRYKGRRPHVRGVVMNPNDHPHGGGEGKSPIGRPSPVTPWGVPTLGYKTRKRNKKSNQFIVKRRK